MEKFYIVGWQGSIKRYDKDKKSREDKFYWFSTNLNDVHKFQFEWVINKDKPTYKLGRTEFSEEYARTIKGFFENLEDAIPYAQQVYEQIVAPDKEYKVARYFDDVFDGYSTNTLSKKDAIEQRDILRNKNKSIYTSYEIKVI